MALVGAARPTAELLRFVFHLLRLRGFGGEACALGRLRRHLVTLYVLGSDPRDRLSWHGHVARGARGRVVARPWRLPEYQLQNAAGCRDTDEIPGGCALLLSALTCLVGLHEDLPLLEGASYELRSLFGEGPRDLLIVFERRRQLGYVVQVLAPEILCALSLVAQGGASFLLRVGAGTPGGAARALEQALLASPGEALPLELVGCSGSRLAAVVLRLQRPREGVTYHCDGTLAPEGRAPALWLARGLSCHRGLTQ
jgi:hypothetical protein